MSSTYSSSLKLTLIGDGDQAGIWGQTTNTNLGTLLEQAIVGVVTIIMSDATYTLSDYNGVSDEARNAVLVITGANTGIRDVVPPVVKKLYTIVNSTSGGNSIRIIGATGTGVTIPNGATQNIYCDGINFYAASTTYGIIPTVSQGGTGATSFTTNSIVLGNGTASLAGNMVAPGTNGNYLRSDGSTWYSAAPPGAEFSSGTRILFQQTAAPTGWTKETAYTDYALRITNGSVTTGGSVNFSTAFASQTPSISITGVTGGAGATTLSTPQIPSHGHDTQCGIASVGQADCWQLGLGQDYPTPPHQAPTQVVYTGGGGSHTHPFSFSSGTATSSAINLAVKYVDAIIAQKN
jgi:hypothetical protein